MSLFFSPYGNAAGCANVNGALIEENESS